jgi:hypothetical protein
VSCYRAPGALVILDLVPEERDDTGRIARLQSHGDEVDAGRDVSEDLRNAQVIRPVRFLRGRLRTGPAVRLA